MHVQRRGGEARLVRRDAQLPRRLGPLFRTAVVPARGAVRGGRRGGGACNAGELPVALDGLDLPARVGREVELVVRQRARGEAGREPEEARVGAGAEGDDLLWGGGVREQEARDEGVDGGGAEVRSFWGAGPGSAHVTLQGDRWRGV